MRSAVVAASLAGLAAAVPQWGGYPHHGGGGSWGSETAGWGTTSSAAPVASSEAPVYTTEVVTAYTTYCPEATKITHGGQTYTATEVSFKDQSFRSTLLTICPGHHPNNHKLSWWLHSHPLQLLGCTKLGCSNYGPSFLRSTSYYRSSILCATSVLPCR